MEIFFPAYGINIPCLRTIGLLTAKSAFTAKLAFAYWTLLMDNVRLLPNNVWLLRNNAWLYYQLEAIIAR
jgi:hypothetical protein